MEAKHCYEWHSMAWNGQVISLAVTRPVFSISSFPAWPAKPIPTPEFPIPECITPCDPSFPGCHYYYGHEARAILASPWFLTTGAGLVPCYALSCSTNQGSVLTRCVYPANPCPPEHHMRPGESIENNTRMPSSPRAEIKSREGPESINASESGWTTYLDQSLCNSNSFTSDADTGSSKEEKSVMADEDRDSSMASDASSGPQQPLEFQQCFGGPSAAEKMGNGGAAIDSRPLRPAKRRRVDSEHEQNLCLLEDTASSPVCSSKSGLTENKLRVKEILELSKGISDSREADAVNRRLDLLQSILPGKTAAQLCREETLGVTMEYINSLEERIKIYKEEPVEERSPNNAVLMYFSGRDQGAEQGPCGALRKRGLCLVPISTLWSSI